MSYDLFLQRRDGTYEPEQFLDYFRAREWYRINGRQAWYANEDTGVYFSFELHEPSKDGDPAPYPISLNVNFFSVQVISFLGSSRKSQPSFITSTWSCSTLKSTEWAKVSTTRNC